MNTIEALIERQIAESSGTPFRIADSKSIGGGCIHNARRINGEDGRQFFVKENREDLFDSFEAEAHSLRKMAGTKTIRVPKPVGAAKAEGKAVLILEFLPIGGSPRQDWQRMGAELAGLHKSTANSFGWDHNNWIGTTSQINTWHEEWTEFYAKCRLAPQVEWARQKGLKLNQAEALMDSLEKFFDEYQPSPALLHGDLWAGNADFLEDGTPVIFDPASYYGDAEADLALTELFGGYPAAFYAGYESVSPIHKGYRTRKELYNLYHVLNHYNIFGGGYGSQAESMMRDLLNYSP